MYCKAITEEIWLSTRFTEDGSGNSGETGGIDGRECLWLTIPRILEYKVDYLI